MHRRGKNNVIVFFDFKSNIALFPSTFFLHKYIQTLLCTDKDWGERRILTKWSSSPSSLHRVEHGSAPWGTLMSWPSCACECRPVEEMTWTISRFSWITHRSLVLGGCWHNRVFSVWFPFAYRCTSQRDYQNTDIEKNAVFSAKTSNNHFSYLMYDQRFEQKLTTGHIHMRSQLKANSRHNNLYDHWGWQNQSS